MINPDILSSVFKSHKIEKVILIEDDYKLNFIVSNMSTSFDIDKWEYLENILKDITHSNVNIIPFCQAVKYFDESYINKGMVIL